MNNRHFKILSLFIPLFLLACAKAPPRSAATLPPQAVDAETNRRISATVEEIARNQAGLDYLSAFAQVSVERGKERRLFDAVLQVAPPGRLSLLVLNDLGQEMASVIADGKEVLFRDFEKGETRRFAQDGEALRKALRLPMTVEDLVDRILLRLPSEEILSVQRDAGDGNSSGYWVLRRGDSLRLLQRDNPRLERYQAGETPKKWRYVVEYSDYASVEKRQFPQRMELSFRKPSLRLRLKLQQISFAPPPSRGIEASFDTRQ